MQFLLIVYTCCLFLNYQSSNIASKSMSMFLSVFVVTCLYCFSLFVLCVILHRIFFASITYTLWVVYHVCVVYHGFLEIFKDVSIFMYCSPLLSSYVFSG